MLDQQQDKEMTELCKLAIKYRTDKCWLGFTVFYSEILKGKSIGRVLEIGIGCPKTMALATQTAGLSGPNTGASLFMWQDYFPEAEIFALDINPTSLINTGRIKSFLCDQGDAESLCKIAAELGKFDLIVDDGSHKPEHQILTAKVLVPHLNPGGIYIIEDVMYPDIVCPQLPFAHEVKEFFRPIPDDRLVIIRG